MFRHRNGEPNVGSIIMFIVFFLVAIIVLMTAGCPRYNVWHQNMRGQAELARAEYNKHILVVEAEMNLEVARFNAQAEVERAMKQWE